MFTIECREVTNIWKCSPISKIKDYTFIVKVSLNHIPIELRGLIKKISHLRPIYLSTNYLLVISPTWLLRQYNYSQNLSTRDQRSLVLLWRKGFSVQSSLEFVVSGFNFEALMKSLRPPFPFQKALRKLYNFETGSESWNPVNKSQISLSLQG